jgi:hypothetical protein
MSQIKTTVIYFLPTIQLAEKYYPIFSLSLERPGKPVGLMEMCLNETYSTMRIGRNLSDRCPIQNGLKQGDTLSPSLVNVALEYAIRNIHENQERLTLSWTQAFGLC